MPTHRTCGSHRLKLILTFFPTPYLDLCPYGSKRKATAGGTKIKLCAKFGCMICCSVRMRTHVPDLILTVVSKTVMLSLSRLDSVLRDSLQTGFCVLVQDQGRSINPLVLVLTLLSWSARLIKKTDSVSHLHCLKCL